MLLFCSTCLYKKQARWEYAKRQAGMGVHAKLLLPEAFSRSPAIIIVGWQSLLTYLGSDPSHFVASKQWLFPSHSSFKLRLTAAGTVPDFTGIPF